MSSLAVVVLGCRIGSRAGAPLVGAAGRRARAAATVIAERRPDAIIAAGGRSWNGRVEADALAEELGRAGVGGDIVRERRSRNTRENALFSRDLLRARGIERVVLVTCAWHMPRAASLFRKHGLEVETFPAEAPASRPVRLYRAIRERVAWLLLVGCSHGSTAPDAAIPDAASDAASPLATLGVAEDTRRADLVTDVMQTSPDVAVRRRAARALARIADAASEPGLLRALGDEDTETAAWGAYGLGFSCKGHEEPRVKALVARAAASKPVTAMPVLDLDFALARAIGRCGGATAEATLAAWVRSTARGASTREHAAYGLGDAAARRGSLDDDTATALLDAAADGVAAALYPFARAQRFNDAFASRLLEQATKVLAGPKTDERVFAVRALGKIGELGAAELSRVATSDASTWLERVDAMRGLGKTGDPAVLADTVAKLVPASTDALAVLGLAGDVYGELLVGLGALGSTPSWKATRWLTPLATLQAPGSAPPSLARRITTLRCQAAAVLAHGNDRAPLLLGCGTGEPLEKAQLFVLGGKPLAFARRATWLGLTQSEHLKVREEALTLIGSHRELGDVGVSVLATALADTAHPGVVATAAQVLVDHPDRVVVLSAAERKAALDPRAPPPTTMPQMEVAPAIAKALASGLLFKWSDDAIETRAGLLDAAAAIRLKGAKEAAKVACGDDNITIREHAESALHALGDEKATCPSVPGAAPAKEVASPHGGKLVLDTDAGTLTIVFDDALAPVASTRILDLAKAGFYEGTVIHRVVPGFVVQLGDPHADGYGGSGQTLRCETSPVPFGPLDVGVALAGRDTGSSQIFVTLGRFPHLDGDYARIGHAEGDWLAVAEGDVVQHAKVE